MKELIVVREDKNFNLRFTLEAAFSDTYEGDQDSYNWVKEWEQSLKPAVIKVIFDTLRKQSNWKVHVRNRGISPLDEIEIAMERDFSTESQDNA